MVIQLGLGKVSGLGGIVVSRIRRNSMDWYGLRQQFVFNHQEVHLSSRPVCSGHNLTLLNSSCKNRVFVNY
jgi:hypothetical protein